MSHLATDPDTFPASQFDDAEQQYITATLGMWTFLITEILFIGAIFIAFFIYRNMWTDAFVSGADELNWKLGTLNTAVLLTSSFTMVMAVHSVRLGKKNALVAWLIVTMLLGFAFLGVKAVEYHQDYVEHLIPGLQYSDVYEGVTRPPQQKLFMSFYFAMTGIHAAHMVAGLLVMGVITGFAKKGSFTPAYPNPIEMAGLYWHFVDLVWVFLFPTLYLLRHVG